MTEIPEYMAHRLDRIENGAYPCTMTVSGWRMTKLIEAIRWCRPRGIVGVDWDYWPNPGLIKSYDFFFIDERVAIEFKLLFT